MLRALWTNERDALIALDYLLRGDTEHAIELLRGLSSHQIDQLQSAADALSTLAWQVRQGRSVPRARTHEERLANQDRAIGEGLRSAGALRPTAGDA